ncbi:MAG: hypothetical protein ACXVEF_15365 [Polyangiales bacterium]
MTSWKRGFAIGGGGLFAAALLLFFGWLVQSCMAARSTSRRFLAALRERRGADAYELAGPALRPLMVDGKLSPTLARVQASNGDELGIVQSGFAGTYPVEPFACFDGALADDKQFWIVARKLPEGWRVVDVDADAMPTICKGD